jgi:anti-sigma regulatory factor (Ser/Thr protein kinase)
MACQLVVPVVDPSQIGEARRTVVRMGAAAGFTEVDQGRLGIIATELGTNLLRHAQHGRLLLQEIKTAHGKSVEILSVDSGPGIGNIEQAFRDGFSTAGTPGNGLGAIRRLSDEFDIYSQLQAGTVAVSRVTSQNEKKGSLQSPAPNQVTENEVVWGAISLPCLHETVCGDTWRVFYQSGRLAVLVADGLGHGPLAAEAADKLAATFDSIAQSGTSVVLQSAHRALSGTRGAAAAIASLNAQEQVWKYAGVGNISGTLCSGVHTRGLCSHNGTVGVQLRKVQEFEYPRLERELLIMHSDGMKTRWSFDGYPGLTMRHPAVIAGVLYRDFERGRDDLTIVVVRPGSFKAQVS